jgi:hypothetical protein
MLSRSDDDVLAYRLHVRGQIEVITVAHQEVLGALRRQRRQSALRSTRV